MAIKNYLKNVSKSVVYSTADIYGEELAQNMGEFANVNKEFLVATYSAIKNPPAALKKAVTSIQESKVYQALDYGVKNVFEDLRTGNFYNKEREDRDTLRLAGMDTDMSLSDYGIDDDWEEQYKNSSKKEKNITDGDIEIVNAIEDSNAAVAGATVNAVVSVGNANIKNSRANVGLLYTQNERLIGGIHNDITAVSMTMNAMHKLQSAALENLDKNTSDYFTATLKLDNERNALLKELVEMQRVQYKSASDKEKEAQDAKKKKNNRWNDVQSGGVIDLSAYVEVVKQNIKQQMGMFDMPQFSEDGNMLATFMASPLKEVMKGFVRGAIPATLKQVTEELDNTFAGIFGNILGAMDNNKNKDGIMGIISKIFGINSSVNATIDTGRYEKGPIPFDGITRKAIIDVIPTYLRRIEAALTERPEQVYDYETGKWTTMRAIRQSYKSIRESAVRSGTASIRKFTEPLFKALQTQNSSDIESLEEAKKEFYEFYFNNRGRFNPNLSADKNNIEMSKYPNLHKYYKLIAAAYKRGTPSTISVNGKQLTVDRSINAKMAGPGDVYTAMDSMERRYRDLEKNTINTVYQQFAAGIGYDIHGKWDDKKNEFKTNAHYLNRVEDKYGNTIFNYLQNINRELTWQRTSGFEDLFGIITNIGFGGGGSGRRARGRGGKSNSVYNENYRQNRLTRHREAFSQINLESATTTRKRQNKTMTEFNKLEEKRNKALELMNKGKAINISYFLNKMNDDEDDEYAESDNKEVIEEYLMYLGDMLEKEESEEFKKQIKSYESNNLTDWYSKHHKFKSIGDVQKALEKEAKDDDEDNDSDIESSKSFIANALDKASKLGNIGAGFLGAATDSMVEVAHNANATIYNMMYHTKVKDVDEFGNEIEYDGFMNMITSRLKNTFDDVKKHTKENIFDPIKKWFGLDKRLEDDEEFSFKRAFTDQLSEMGKGLWKDFVAANKEIYSPLGNEILRQAGIKKEETIQKKNRRISREKYMKDLETIDSFNLVTDPKYIDMMKEYGLNFIEYGGNIEDAKQALREKIQDNIHSNSKGLSELESTDQFNAAIESIKRKYDNDEDRNKAIAKYAEAFGIKVNPLKDGERKKTQEEIFNELTGKITNFHSLMDDNYDATYDKRGNIIKRNAANEKYRSKDKRNDLNLAIQQSLAHPDSGLANEGLLKYAEELGFVGDREQKIKMLKYQNPNLTDKHIEKLDSDEKLALNFLRGFSKNHAEGTMGKPFSGITALSKGELLFNKNGVSRVNKTGVYDITTPTDILNSPDSHDLLKFLGMDDNELGVKSTIQDDLGKENLAKKKLMDAIPGHATSKLASSINISNIDKSMAKDVLNDAKMNVPEVAAGGLVGMVVSTLFNIIGGPLLGGAVGAAGTLLTKSESLKKILFGEEKDGEREGGVISKDLIKKAKEIAPNMYKYGLAGIIPGLLTPLGPIGGIMAGAAFGFLKGNEKIRNKFFGDSDLIIKESEKSILKKLLPGAVKGAGVGAATSIIFGGPFGLIGNTVLGSAIGMMTTTDDFKESIFGREIDGVRSGGLLGEVANAFAPLADAGRNLADSVYQSVEQNIVIPLKKFTTPFIHQLPRILGYLPRRFGDFVEKHFATTVGGFIKKHVTDKLQPIVNVGSKVVGWGFNKATAPVRLLGKIGDNMTANAIERREADYMTAKERIEHMTNVMGKNNYKGKDLDIALSTVGSDAFNLEKAKELRSSLATLTDSESGLKSAIRNQEKQLDKALAQAFEGKLNSKDIAKVEKLVAAGDIDGAMNALRKHVVNGSKTGITSEQFKDILSSASAALPDDKSILDVMERRKILGERLNNVKNLTDDKRSAEANAVRESLKALGVEDLDLNDKHAVADLYKLLDTEITNREAGGEANTEKYAEQNAQNIADLATNLKNIATQGLKIATGTADNKDGESKTFEETISESIHDGFQRIYEEMHREEVAKAMQITGASSEEELSEHYSTETISVIGAKAKSKVPFSKKTGVGDNKNAIAASNYKDILSKAELDACNGKVERIGKIKKKGILFNKKELREICGFINNCTEVQYRNLSFCLNEKKNRYIVRFCKGAELSLEDFKDFANTNIYEVNTLNNTCKVLLSNGYKFGDEDINSIKKLMSVDVTKYENKAHDSVKTVVGDAVGTVGDYAKKGVKTVGKAGLIAAAAVPVGVGAAVDFAGEKVLDPALSNAERGTRKARKVVKNAADVATTAVSDVLNNEVDADGSEQSVKDIIQNDINKVTTEKDENGNIQIVTTEGDKNEIDVEGDGREVAELAPGKFGYIKRDSSGNIEPDTSDSKTKDIIDEVTKKEEKEDEANEAQATIAETLNNALDISDEPKGKKFKGKIMKYLLTGGALVGTLLAAPVIDKLYNKMIKPVWTNHIKPFITDKVVPWITDVAIPWVGKTISSLIPKLMEGIKTLTPILADVIGEAGGLLFQQLPNIIATAVQTVLNIGGHGGNVGGHTKVTGEDINEETYESSEGFTDENGNKLTVDQVKNRDFNKIYNAEGVEGTIDENGNVDFKDQSSTLGQWTKTVGNAAFHAAVQGSGGIGARMATRVASKAAKSVGKSIFRPKKLARSAATYLFAKPVSAAAKVGDKVGEKVGKALFKENAEIVIKKNKKTLVQRLVDRVMKFCKDLLSNKKILSKVDDAAVEMAEKNTDGFVTKLLGWVEKTFKSSAEKAVGEAAQETVEKAISKANLILTVATAVVDFLLGFDRAESILGVSEATTVEKFVCGLINAIVNAFVIFSIVPGVNFIARTLLGLFADAMGTNLKDRQKEADKEYEEYKKNTGSTKTKEEYLAAKYSNSGKVGNWFSTQFQKVKNKFSSWLSKDSSNEKKSNNISASGAYGTGISSKSGTTITRAISSKSNSNKISTYGKGAYSKQIDPSISGLRYNDINDTVYQTIGDSGCGPAAAVNALEAMYGRGGADVVDAASFALLGGYKEQDGGTMPGFFTDYFANNGYNSEIISNKKALANSILSGNPTVLMGKDPNGVSSSTPYGKNPHYVTATGVDSKGRVIVQDPESKYDNQLYSMNDILNKTQFGASVYGTGAKYGMGDTEESMIWWYLKQMGMTDAGAAGVMGNMFAESGFKTNNMQNSYESQLGMNDESYTSGVDNGSYTNFVNDRVGYGLVQWTSAGRKQALLNYIKANNKGSISSMSGQLEFFNQELQGGSYGNMLSMLQSTNSVDEASYKVLKDFEQPNGVDLKRAQRTSYSNLYYTKFNGKEGTPVDDAKISVSGSTSSSSTSSTSSDAAKQPATTIGGILAEIISNSAIGKLFNSFLGIGDDDTDSTSSDTTASAENGHFGDGRSFGDTTSSNTSDSASTVAQKTTLRVSPDVANMINIAQQQVGIGGNPKGSNANKFNDWYYGTHVSGNAYPWCAAFVSWVANQAGIPTNVIPKDAYTVTSRDKILANGGREVSMAEAEPGDILYWDKNSKIHHTGIVEYNDGSRIHTIEGNVSDVVQRREFDYNAGLYVDRPNYATQSKTANITVGGTGTGNKPLSKYGQFKESINGKSTKNTLTGFVPRSRTIASKDANGNIGYISYSGVDQKINEYKEKNKFGTGSKSAIDNSKLISSIITILYTIADNTDKLNTIVTILNNKLGTSITSNDISANTGKETLKQKLQRSLNNINMSNDNVTNNDNIYSIINVMNAIAAE